MAQLNDLLVLGYSNLLGTVNVFSDILPSVTNTHSLGTSDLKWKNVYATTFYGAFSGTLTGNVSGNAGSATKLQTGRTFTISSTANTTSPTFNGTGNITLTVPKDMSGFNRLSFNSTNNTTSPTGQSIVLNGVDNSTDTGLAPGIGFHIGNKSWGSLKFLSDGTFRFYNNACSGYMSVYASTFHGSLSGNATSATKATQDGDGNTISTTYAKLKSMNDMVHSTNEWTVVPSGYSGALWLNYRTCGGTNGNITHYNFGNAKGSTAGVTLVADAFSGTAAHATSAGKISDITESDKASSSATKRRIWFAYSDNTTGRPAYDDRFTIQTSTGTLFAPIFSGAFTGTLTGNVTGTASVARLTEVILNDSSNWKLGLQWRNTTLESGTYLAGIGRHNTGGSNATYPGTISIVPYATDTSPWGGSVGLFINKDYIQFENQPLLHSGNYTTYTVKKDGTGASGTWGINITGNAATASSVAWSNISGKPSTYAPSSHNHDFITYKDTRSNKQSPDDVQAGLTVHLKSNGTDGLSDGGSYHALLSVKDWGDYSGGPYWQSAVTANNNMYFRRSTAGTTWGAWQKVLSDNNYADYTVTKTGSGASGTWGISVTGSANLLKAGASLTSETADSALESTASLKINTCNNTVYNTNDGLILTASWSAAYGAQIWLDDGGGEGGMAIRNRNANGWNSWRQILSSGNYTSYTVTKTGGGASGTWGINISGNAATATSANALASTGYGNNNFTWVQTSGEFAGNSGWTSYLISNHGDGSNYYHQIIAIPFWDAPKYRRMEGNTSTIKGWYDFITDENYTTKLDARYYTEAEADSRFVNVTGDSMTGTLSWGGNVSSLNLRTGHASYDGVISYQTSGNEAMLFTTKNAVTSFMFINGEDTITNMAADRWTKVTPGLQIKNNCVAIGKLIGNDATPSYKLEVNGTGYFSNNLSIGGKLIMTGNIAYTNGGNQYDIIRFVTGDANGAGVVIGGGGTAIFGSGESAYNFQGSSGANIGGATETTYITSDNGIEFYTNCQTIGNRVGTILNASRQFYPNVNATGSLGTSSYKWGSVWTSGTVTADKLKISNTSGVAHIEFSRASLNYLHAPSDAGSIALCANATLSLANSGLVVAKTQVYPGADNTFGLGSASYRWQAVYATTIIANQLSASTTHKMPIYWQHSGSRYGEISVRNNAGTTIAGIISDCGNATTIQKHQWTFRSYCANSTNNTATSGYYEDFKLPESSDGRTASTSYTILTTKASSLTYQVGRLIASATQDASATAANKVALITGSPSGQHLEFDDNEIISKTNGTTGGDLYINSGGNNTYLYKIAGVSGNNYGTAAQRDALSAATGQIFFVLI